MIPGYIREIALSHLLTTSNMAIRVDKYYIDIRGGNKVIIRDIKWEVLEEIENIFA